MLRQVSASWPVQHQGPADDVHQAGQSDPHMRGEGGGKEDVANNLLKLPWETGVTRPAWELALHGQHGPHPWPCCSTSAVRRP